MKLVHALLNISVVVFNTCLFGCQQPEIEYRKAHSYDAHSIIDLINKHGVNDNDKIVILPELFRLKAIESAIEKGRIFVACNAQNNTIVGYKKLFLLSDTSECVDTLFQEIRCAGQESEPIDTAYFTSTDNYSTRQRMYASSDTYAMSDTYIYNGADFTHPDFRGKGINTHLTDTALTLTKEATLEHIRTHQAKHLIMLYGLTRANDYDNDNNGKSRTPSIVRSFASFIHTSIQHTENSTPTLDTSIRHNRYKAFMPTFNPDATECKPLSDEYSVPGYGNVLSYSLEHDEK
jgi:GNAT superfamily N-acetyltransferase